MQCMVSTLSTLVTDFSHLGCVSFSVLFLPHFESATQCLWCFISILCNSIHSGSLHIELLKYCKITRPYLFHWGYCVKLIHLYHYVFLTGNLSLIYWSARKLLCRTLGALWFPTGTCTCTGSIRLLNKYTGKRYFFNFS